MTLTIRERINAVSAQMVGSKPTPDQLSEFEVSLSGLLAYVNDEVTEAELAYRQAIVAAEAPTNAGRQQLAQAGPEYARYRHAQAAQLSCEQMLVTCRSAIRLRTEELRAR